MEKVVIIGNSGLASVLHEYLIRDTRYAPVGIAVDRPFITAGSMLGLAVCDLADIANRFDPADHKVFIAVGYSDLLRTREALYRRLCQLGYEVLRYVHPDARVYSNRIGAGAWIMPNAVIDVHARIGDNSVVWANCTVAHNAVVGENCWLASGCVVSADVTVGRNTFIGINASIVNGVIVGSHNIIGANALVTKDTEDHEVTLCGQHGKFRLNSEEFIKWIRL